MRAFSLKDLKSLMLVVDSSTAYVRGSVDHAKSTHWPIDWAFQPNAELMVYSPSETIATDCPLALWMICRGTSSHVPISFGASVIFSPSEVSAGTLPFSCIWITSWLLANTIFPFWSIENTGSSFPIRSTRQPWSQPIASLLLPGFAHSDHRRCIP
eukprot:gene5225-biopygen5148